MAGADKTVKVTLVAVASPYVKGTSEAAAATSKLGRDIDNVGTKSQAAEGKMGKLTGSLKGMGLAAGAVAGTALVAFLGDAVKAAGDLEQSVGGVDAVFGATAKTIHDFGKDSAESVGLSTNAFNELVTVTGAMLKNKGLEDFTQKSIDLVKIGADLSATFGGTAKDAVEALNAAMRGESDPIERYGISLNETAVNAELASKGLQGLTGSALDQAKAQARIDIIARQSADAMGKFASEADTLQGQQQRLTAEWENAKATLGQALLPTLTDVVDALRGGVDVVVAVAGAWEKVPGPVKAAIAALIGLRVLRGPVTGALDAVRTNMQRLREEMALQQALAGGIRGGYQRLGDEAMAAGRKVSKGAVLAGVGTNALRTAGKGLFGMLGGPWGAAIAGATVLLGSYMQAQSDAKARVQALTDTIDKQTGAFTDNSRATLRDALMGSLSGSDQKLLQDLGVSYTELANSLLAGGDAWKVQLNRLVELRKAHPEARAAISGLTDEFLRQVPAAQDAADAGAAAAKEEEKVGDNAKTATPKLKDYKDVVGDIEQITSDAEDAQQRLAKAILGVYDAAIGADSAESDYQETLDAINERVAERARLEKELRKETDPKKRAELRAELEKYAKGLDLTNESGRENSKLLRDQAKDAEATAKAMLLNGDGADIVKQKMADMRQEFIKNAAKFGIVGQEARDLANDYGFTTGKVDALIDTMGEVPSEVTSTITLDTIEAQKKLATFKLMYDGLGNKQITLSAVFQTQGFEAAQAYRNRFATGGSVVGPGTATSDSIPAYLSNGEYVIKASAVEKYGKHFFDSVNAMRFASGGYVSRMPAAGPAIDYDRLAAANARARGGDTFNAYGLDVYDAIRKLMNDREWEARRGY